jgi:hypothetical protein
LAALCGGTGDYSRAERLLQQALEASRAAVGERQRLYAAGLSELAGLYHGRGDLARAEPLYQHALEIRRAALRERHPRPADRGAAKGKDEDRQRADTSWA